MGLKIIIKLCELEIWRGHKKYKTLLELKDDFNCRDQLVTISLKKIGICESKKRMKVKI